MIIDEKGKLFGKLSVVDILIALIIIAAVFVVGVKIFGSGGAIRGSTVACEYTMSVKNIRAESVDAITRSTGLDLYDTKGYNVGTIKEITEVKPYEMYVNKSDGTIVKAAVPERFEIKFKVQSEAAKSGNSYLLGGKSEVSNASNLTVSTELITVESVISEITVFE